MSPSPKAQTSSFWKHSISKANRSPVTAVTVVSTAPNPVRDSLRISEFNYNPLAATAAELAVDRRAEQ